ncbi:hypothetical protein ACOMHN_047907 [Nucella lapillus]
MRNMKDLSSVFGQDSPSFMDYMDNAPRHVSPSPQPPHPPTKEEIMDTAFDTPVHFDNTDSLDNDTNIRGSSRVKDLNEGEVSHNVNLTEDENAFDTSQGLNAHQRVHIKVCIYQCTERFQPCQDLQAHTRLHLGSKALLCVFFNALFPTVKGLNIHLTKYERDNIPSVSREGEDKAPIAFALVCPQKTAPVLQSSGQSVSQETCPKELQTYPLGTDLHCWSFEDKKKTRHRQDLPADTHRPELGDSTPLTGCRKKEEICKHVQKKSSSL